MKFIIIGKQGSGKHKILDILAARGVKVGREFSNLPERPEQVYIDPRYEYYPMEDIHQIFETKSYLFLSGLEESGVKDSYIYYRGISHYTYDQSDVLAISTTQLDLLDKSLMDEPVVFVWLDNTRDFRIRTHAEENRTYSFVEQEEIESRSDVDFVKNLYAFPKSSVLYFTNEVPERVATILYALIQHPDLVDSFIENFN